MRRLVLAAALAAPGGEAFAAGAVARHFNGVPEAGDHARAGYPTEVKPHAQPSNPHTMTGGYVGGGRLALPKKQDGRRAYEGTWGWDYVGLGHRPGRVFLDFWHGRPKEPAYGSYSPEGPEVPDPIAARRIQKFLKGEGKGEGGEE